MARDGTTFHREKSVNHVEDKGSEAIDGKRSWFIVMGSFFNQLILMGIISSLGVIYVHLLDEFKETKGYTSCILSLNLAMTQFTCPISSYLVDKYGFRAVAITGTILATTSLLFSCFAQNVFTLIITIGFGLGFSFGLIYLPSIVCVNVSFKKYRSIAVGMAVAGSGFGVMIFPLVAAFTNSIYGWRGTVFILYTGSVMTCGLFSSFFRTPKSPEISNEDDKNVQTILLRDNVVHREQVDVDRKPTLISTYIDLAKNPMFILFLISNIATNTGYYLPIFCLSDHAIELGMTKAEGSFLISIVGATNTLGRIFWGYLSDKTWINRFYVYISCLILCGLSTIVSILCVNFWALALYSSVYGLTAAAYFTLQSVILIDFFGSNKLNAAFGLIKLFQSPAALIGAPLVGLFHEHLHSYHPGFIFTGTVIGLSGFILLFMPIFRRKRFKKEMTCEDNDLR